MKIRSVILVTFSAFVCGVAFADGGHLRFSQAAGPFQVTLFTAPEPLTAGPADFSVMVQDGTSNQILPDADIDLTLTAADGRVVEAHARAGLATNKLLQAADVALPVVGAWHVVVQVKQGGRTGSCDADIVVGAGSRKRYLVWIFSLLPVFATMLFVLNQKQKSNVRPPGTSAN